MTNDNQMPLKQLGVQPYMKQVKSVNTELKVL